MRPLTRFGARTTAGDRGGVERCGRVPPSRSRSERGDGAARIGAGVTVGAAASVAPAGSAADLAALAMDRAGSGTDQAGSEVVAAANPRRLRDRPPPAPGG